MIATQPRPVPASPVSVPALEPVAWHGRAMGGRCAVWVRACPGDGTVAAARDVARVAARIGAWAARITRFDEASELSRLNRDVRRDVPVGPTLTAALEWAADAGRVTDGIVDVTLLDARLRAETHARGGVPALLPDFGDPTASSRMRTDRRHWTVERRERGGIVLRPPGLRFDLDGVGKGWIADRALRLLDGHPGALVDADGDLAVRVAAGDRWDVGVEDPRSTGFDLAVLSLPGGQTFGLATSGVSVHRWGAGADATHHLIDPATGRPADTDVVQATVLARSARVAETLAKTAVILGSAAGLAFLDRTAVLGAIVLTTRGERLALPQTLEYLA